MSFSEDAKQSLRAEDFNGLQHQIESIDSQQIKVTKSLTDINEIILRDITILLESIVHTWDFFCFSQQLQKAYFFNSSELYREDEMDYLKLNDQNDENQETNDDQETKEADY